MPDNRRTSTRYPVDLAVTLSMGEDSINAQMMNLSLGGALVAGIDRLPMETQLTVSFRVPTMEQAISVTGTVRWCTEDGVGLQFGGLRAREVWSLNKYFEQLAEG